MDLTQLYQQSIRDYAKEEEFFHKMEDADQVIEAYNPYCGDQFKLYLKFEGETIKEATFHGYGCAISKASSAILTEAIQQKSIPEVKELLLQFKRILDEGGKDSDPEKLKIFEAAKAFPGRETCATLSWDELAEALKK